MIKKANNEYKILYIILIILMTLFGGLFSGKLISASIERSIASPYHFEKVVAEVVDTKFYRAAHGKYWLDYYCLIACYTDAEAGTDYYAQLSMKIHDEAEAELHIGEKAYILIDRNYGKAISYSENAIKSDVPIDIIVYSILLAFSLVVLVLSIFKITKRDKRHWIWIAICILLMLGLAAWVAYASFDFNYLDALK